MFFYYQIHPTNINKTAGGPSSEDGITAKVSESTCSQSIQNGSCLSFGAKLLCKAHPKTPHSGPYLHFWCFFPPWAFLELYPLWHVIKSRFTAALLREASLKVHFKESLAFLREMHVSFLLPRETASLVFPRETPSEFPRERKHLVLLHHLQMSIQKN
jgi:hypothetical protein